MSNEAETNELQPPAVLPWVSPDAYQQARLHVFPTLEAWRYFIRQHRAELIDAEALMMPTGRLLVEPFRFDQVVQRVGLRMAAGRQQ